jgi:Protein of unknown function (DUF3089)
VILTVLACALALVLPATSAAARPGAPAAVKAPKPPPTVWLCRPGLARNPCALSPAATVLAPDGAVIGMEHPRVPAHPPIDCFFVYPTVSDQQTANANLHIDPEERAIAEIEASRFSQVCRVWAPMYRQITLFAIDHPSVITPEAHTIAYEDVRDAWTDYLEHHNHGRGVVLIGHSQAAKVLRQLIQEEIEPRPSSLRRLVSALLIGGNVIVPRGQDVGGDFKNVPACRSTTQTGCVVAYSTFNQPPPPDARYGRAQHATRQVLCTNPAAIGGGDGPLRTYLRAAPFPGSLEQQFLSQLGPLPSVRTPWISEPNDYRGSCVDSGGVSRLQLTADPAAPVLTPTPNPTWGLHLDDIPLALGSLTRLVGEQATAWLHSPRSPA